MPLNLKARLRRIGARAPVSRLFLKIFLWFWCTALGAVCLVVMASRFTGMKVISPPNMLATVSPIVAAEAVKAYETGGPEGFARFSQNDADESRRRLYLLDGFNKDVLSRPVSEDGLRVVRAAKLGQLVILRSQIAVYKCLSSSGHPYALVLYMRPGFRQARDILLGEDLFFTTSFVLLVTVFCFWLAHHIASPIFSIQGAARRVAQGDLKARVPVAVTKRHDELASLARDFDSMVDRIETLIGTQKDLLSSVSHELRSPLSRINLSVGLLRKFPHADNQDTLQRLERDVSKIDLLMGQLLTLSRLEAGLSFGERMDVDLTQIVEEVVADGNFEAQATGKSVTFLSSGSVGLSNADPHALRSACENIIRNAIRFTPTGTTVRVALERDDRAADPLATLSICDEGPGVPEESLESIFRPFVRIGRDDDYGSGNGLGLAIASEAIRAHHGVISATNLSPVGFEIRVQLPFAHRSAVYEQRRENVAS